MESSSYITTVAGKSIERQSTLFQRTIQDIERSLTNIPPKDDFVIQRIEAFRESAKVLGRNIINNVPEGREKSLALTNLEECVMWAVKGIILRQGEAQ